MNPARRPLTFTSLEQVMPDVDRLLEGHKTVGAWTLGQICGHLTGAFTSTVDGFRFQCLWIVQKTGGTALGAGEFSRHHDSRGTPLPQEVLSQAGSRCSRRSRGPARRDQVLCRTRRPAGPAPARRRFFAKIGSGFTASTAVTTSVLCCRRRQHSAGTDRLQNRQVAACRE